MNTTFPSRRLTAACLAGAALLMCAGFAVTPWEAERTTAAYHDALAANPGQAQVAALLLHAGFLLVVPAAFGMVAAAGGRGGWWTRAGAVLTVAGLITLPGLLVTDAYDLALAQQLDRTASVRVSDVAAGTPLAIVLSAPAGVGLMAGTIALVTGLWRARQTPGVAPLLVLAGWAVSFAGFGLVPALAGGLLFAAGSAIVAASLTRGFTPARSAPAPVTA